MMQLSAQTLVLRQKPLQLLRFGTQQQNHELIQQKLDSLRADLAPIQSDPNFLHFNLNSILQKAKSFFTQQQKHPEICKPYMIHVTGGSASGKTAAAKEMVDTFNGQAECALKGQDAAMAKWIGWQDRPIVKHLGMDNYFNSWTESFARLGDKFYEQIFWDTPLVMALDKMASDLKQFKKGFAIWSSTFNFESKTRYDNSHVVQPAPFAVVEGLFALTEPFKNIPHLSVFVDVADKEQRERWFPRAQNERDMSGDIAAEQFARAQLGQKHYIEPTRANAQIVLNGNVSLDEIKQSMSKLSAVLLKHMMPQPYTTEEITPPLFEHFDQARQFIEERSA